MSVMTARYAGKCAGCGQRFPQGTLIDYRRDNGRGKGRAYHLKCADKLDGVPTDNTEEEGMGAQKARKITLYPDRTDAVMATDEDGIAQTVYMNDLPRAEVLRAAKLAFPTIDGRAWWKVDLETVRRAVIERDAEVAFPDGVDAAPKAAIREQRAEAADTGDAAQLAALIGKLAGGAVDEQKVRAIVAEAVAAAMNDAPVKHVEIHLPDRDAKLPETHHSALPEIIMLAAAGCHVFMVGPAGSGKSTIAHQAADALGRPFYALSLGPTTPTSKLFGYMDAASNYVRTPFRDAYENGGVMLLDELDNGHPGLVAEINQALANGYCAFADGMVKRHDSFVMLATGNTFGRGPDRMFVGRNILDAATLDRFATVEVDYDVKLERSLAMAYATDETRETIRRWVDTVLSVREKALKLKLPVVVSPRSSIDGARLIAAGMTPERVADVRLWAGVPADQRAKLDA